MPRSNILQHNLSLLKSSSIAEKHSKDIKSKFWATYKKVADEYDDDFLQQVHGDIGIILTFVHLLLCF
ncbi:hypothetical protein BDR06DRAFT_876321 [Suillus hirtellus]|nr:hypothetical protein BDR06DRAFT_876321 [Suillus hirtellus]